MSATTTALADFRAAYDVMLQAAERVRVALEAEGGRADTSSPHAIIQETVARCYGFTRQTLISNLRTGKVSEARQVAMWCCRMLTKDSLQDIATAFQRDHGTVSYAIKAMADRSSVEPKLATELLDVRHRCEVALEGSK